MQRLRNCQFIIDIEMIENISGANQVFEIIFTTTDKEVYKFIFTHVWDMRCSIENASIDRFCEFRKNTPVGTVDNGVYIVENSEYIKYFDSEASGTLPAEDLTHYILCDRIDTVVDILVCEDHRWGMPRLMPCNEVEGVITHAASNGYNCFPHDITEA